mgnify:CR=1 FL=1
MVRGYDKIKLDPVTIWAGEGSEFEDFTQPQRQELADTLYTMLTEELSQDFQMVDDSDEDREKAERARSSTDKNCAANSSVSASLKRSPARNAFRGRTWSFPAACPSSSPSTRPPEQTRRSCRRSVWISPSTPVTTTSMESVSAGSSA